MDANKDAAAANVVQNIETVLAVQARTEERLSLHHQFIEKLTSALARPRTTYLFLALSSVWIIFNAARGPKEAIDPAPFFWLQGLVGALALFMTTLVLTTQRIQGARSVQRAHLDLQVNLIAEQKITKLIALVEELRRDLPSVVDRRDSVAEAMSEAVDPHQVADVLRETASSDVPSKL